MSSTENDERSLNNISMHSIRQTQKDLEIDQNENSQHSFGSSAFVEMKKQVNDFFQQCNSELSFDEKVGSENDKASSWAEKQCRVCLWGDDELSEDELENNPLFSIWAWAGSTKYIHLKCIRTWLEGKIHK